MIKMNIKDVLPALPVLTSRMQSLINNCFLCVHGFDNPDDLQSHLFDHAKDVNEANIEGPFATLVLGTVESLMSTDQDAKNINGSRFQDMKSIFKNYSKTAGPANGQVREAKPILCKGNPIEVRQKHQTVLQTKKGSIHTNSTKHKCTVCNKVFTTKGKLKKHQISHHVMKNWCSMCNEGFKLKRSLHEHKLSLHGGFNCSTCDKICKSIYHLKKHEREHFKPRCTLCNDNFKLRSELELHMQSAHGVKPDEFKSDKGLVSKNASNVHFKTNLDLETMQLDKKQCIKCHICGSKFKKSHLPQHMEAMHSGKVYVCAVCNKTYRWKSHYDNHVKGHTETPIPCEVCGKLFPTKADINYHMRTHQHRYSCSTCGKTFSKGYTLKRHDLLHNPDANVEKEGNYQCRICGKSFYEYYRRIDHQVSHAQLRPYCCKECGGRFSTQVNLNTHRRRLICNSQVRKLWNCAVCLKWFQNESDHSAHVPKHNGSHLYECSQCGSGQATLHALIDHIGDHLAKSEWDEAPLPKKDKKEKKVKEKVFKFSCEWCSKTYCIMYELKMHIATKHDINKADIKKTWCDICQKLFPSRTFDKHKVKHTNERPYICEVCGKSFRYRSSLKAHMQEHTGIYNNKCKMCHGMSFRYHKQLVKHMETEHGIERPKKPGKEKPVVVKPFHCSDCGRGFSHKSSLQLHMRQHTGKYSYKCTMCDNSFIYKYQLGKHMENAHGAEPYEHPVNPNSVKESETSTVKSEMDELMLDERQEEPVNCRSLQNEKTC